MESVLPPRPRTEIPTGENVEEVNLVDFDGSKGSGVHGARLEAYHDDDEEDGHGGHPRMQCQHQ